MLVRNLVSWAGPYFARQPGDLVELDDATAEARIAAGLAQPVENYGPPAPPSSPTRPNRRPPAN